MKNLQEFVGGTIKAMHLSGAHGDVLYITLQDGRQLYIASETAHTIGLGTRTVNPKYIDDDAIRGKDATGATEWKRL